MSSNISKNLHACSLPNCNRFYSKQKSLKAHIASHSKIDIETKSSFQNVPITSGREEKML